MNIFFIFIRFSVSFFLFFVILNVFSRSPDDLLKKADSLFQKNKYTESIILYEDLFFNHKIASSQMLLKMAYIKENLKEYDWSLFYLNTYYTITKKDVVFNQIQSIAKKMGYLGYERSDKDYFLHLFSFYKEKILIFVVSIMFILLLIQFFIRYKQKHLPIGFLMGHIFFAAVIVFLLTYPIHEERAIIKEKSAYIMNGPSAASSLVDKVSNGHIIQILDKQPIWSKIVWNGREVYIKTNSLLFL
ncbi:MAG: SH3 domain-containing protein [Chitinophagaceae bacterium]|nr:SH3 domain-containing protein [Chitinophagaceae bacterium]